MHVHVCPLHGARPACVYTCKTGRNGCVCVRVCVFLVSSLLTCWLCVVEHSCLIKEALLSYCCCSPQVASAVKCQ